MNIGPVLRQARIAAGIQQQALARLLGVRTEVLCRLELGTSGTFKDQWLSRLPDGVRQPVAEALAEEFAQRTQARLRFYWLNATATPCSFVRGN